MRPPLAIALLVLAAVGWGVAGHAMDQSRAGVWVSALGAPWLVLAFAAGVVTRTHRRAGLAGATFLLLAVGAYYVPFVVVDSGAARYAVKIGLAWGAVAAVLGALFAVAGATWIQDPRSRSGAIAAAVPGGALAGEALLLRTQWHSAGAPEALRIELGAAVVLAALTARRPLALTAAVLAVVTAGIAADELRDLLRAAGWQGA